MPIIMKTMNFETRSAAQNHISSNGIVGFPHESNRIGARGWIVVVMHEGRMWSINADTTSMTAMDW